MKLSDKFLSLGAYFMRQSGAYTCQSIVNVMSDAQVIDAASVLAMSVSNVQDPNKTFRTVLSKLNPHMYSILIK